MEFITNFEYLLPLIFFIVALVYSSVGLGGGSSYTAIMILAGMSSLVVPMLTLILNLLVSSIGSYNFLKNKHAKISIIMPFLISAIPMSYLGGSLQLPKEIFLIILLVSLVAVSARIYIWKDNGFRFILSKQKKIAVSIVLGSILGILSGIVGIGGGIYLVPLIIALGIGSHKQAAATGAIFIWMVSLSGLISRMQYNSIDLSNYVNLIIAVIIGGIIGSHFGSTGLNPKQMEKVLGVIILVAIIFILRRLIY